MLNKKLFFKILIVYFTLAVIWTVVCILDVRQSGKYNSDLAYGFISIYAVSFVIGLDLWKSARGLFLIIVFNLVFIAVTFIVGPLITLITDTILTCAFVSSLSAMTILALILNSFHKISYLKTTILAAAILALPAYFIGDKDYLYFKYDISPGVQIFNVWQGLTIIPLALGLSLEPRRLSINPTE